MRYFVMFFLLILLVSACSSTPVGLAPEFTYTPYPTYTPFPTYTIYPTYTPYPTDIPATATPTYTQTPDLASQADAVLNAFLSAGIPITNTVVYTAETDPNQLLGRPFKYIAKVSWMDSRISVTGEMDVDKGGTLEIFANSDDLQARKQYIESITSGPLGSLVSQYIYARSTMLLRLSGKLTPEEAKGYEDIFTNLP